VRAERDRLRRQLDQAPRDRSRELAQATTHRQQAEEALAARQQPTGRQPAGMLRWFRRDGDQPARMPGGLAVATEQANRTHDRERALRQHQQHRGGWLEANTHLGLQYRRVVRTLAGRVAAALGIGAGGVVLTSTLLAPRLGLVVGALAAMAAGWGLRFRPRYGTDATAWRRGAAGERRTGRLLHPLERQGWAVLHDLAIPGGRATSTTWRSGPAGCS
jgi:hypothetical protein